MIVALDMDGCLANFNEAYARILTSIHGMPYPIHDPNWPKQWHWEREGAEAVTARQITQAWDQIKWDPDFWVELNPYPGVHEFLSFIRQFELEPDNTVYFITNRVGRAPKWQTERWLKKHGGLLNPTVLLASEKGFVCKGLGVDYALDDAPQYCSHIKTFAPETNMIMLKRPWNYTMDGIPRIDSLDIFKRILENHYAPKRID